MFAGAIVPPRRDEKSARGPSEKNRSLLPSVLLTLPRTYDKKTILDQRGGLLIGLEKALLYCSLKARQPPFCVIVVCPDRVSLSSGDQIEAPAFNLGIPAILC